MDYNEKTNRPQETLDSSYTSVQEEAYLVSALCLGRKKLTAFSKDGTPRILHLVN
jgi:hypothetical protein